ncbi:MAG: 4-hydroxybenzoate octaprenyltransferase [Polaromonas sp.]|nr:4-hydroxybenzoate octaprenyltransferase [Polaromonas sp.]
MSQNVAPHKSPIAHKLSLYLDLIRWDRPAGWLLLLWPTLSALWMAAGGFPGWHLLAVFVLGTIVMRSAGCCVNDVADKDFDKHVKRTAVRPVTRGAVSSKEALILGAVLALVAFAMVLTTNRNTVLWSFVALAIALIYPFTKRFFSMPQAVLGVAFSFGIPMAFSAAQGAVPLAAWLLLLANLFWVLAYDTTYAMVDRDDDLKIGIQTSAITMGRFDVLIISLCYLFYISFMAVAGLLYVYSAIYFIALAVASVLALWFIALIRERKREDCFKAFRLNHWLGFTVFAGVALNFVLK